MTTLRCCLAVIVVSGTLLAGSRARAADPIVTPAMAGHWEGKARIVVSWCRQTALPVAVDIRADGQVTGRVGDARLVHGRLKRNRGWLGRQLDWATDYIIRGELDGPVVAAEGIVRKGVSIPLNFAGKAFTGGVHTTGSKFGGKDRMILTAGSLTLRHPE